MSTLKTNNIQHVDRSDPSIIINTDGSVNIAGTMTYEDVTNVDAVGIITGRSNIDAQKQVHVGTGVSVKAGGINVTAGITTVQALQATTGTFSSTLGLTGNLTITNTAPQISLVDSDNNSDFSIYGAGGVFNIYDETNSASRLTIASDGVVTIAQGLLLSSTLTIPDSIIHSGDTNTKIRFPAADTITAETSGTERFRVDSSGNIYVGGVGGSATAGSLWFNDTSANASKIAQSNGNSALTFHTGSSQPERLRIDSDGRLLINTTTNRNKYFNGTYTGQLQVEGTNDSTRLSQFIYNNTGGGGHILVIGKSRGTSTGSYTAVVDTNTLGTLSFQGADGDEMVDGARIEAQVNGTPSNDVMPTDLLFKTNTGQSSPTERLRITEFGRVIIGTTDDTSHTFGYSWNPKLQLESNASADYCRFSLVYNGNDGVGPGLVFGKSRGTSIGSNTVVSDGDQIGGLFFQAADGTDKNCRAATIICYSQGSSSGNDTPGKLVFATTADTASDSTTRMVIDSTGNTHFGSGGTLNGSNTVSIVPADGLINFGMDGRDSFVTSTNSAYIYSGEGSSGTTLAGDLILQSRSNQNRTIRFVTGSTPVERGKFNEYGLYVTGVVSGKAASLTSSKAGNFDPFVFDVSGNAQSTETVSIKSQKNDCLDLTRYYTAGTIQTFRFNNDFTGRIETGTTSVTYHTSSDYRLKENAVSISDGITRLKQLKPYKFNFIKEPSVIHDGFFAHEVTPVVPTAVSGEKDATETRYYETGDVLPEGKEIGDIKEENAVLPQSLDHSKLVPLLTAALQEAIAKIETMEAQIAALIGG